MAVKEEIAAARAAGASDRSIGSLKAQRISEQLEALPPQQRTYNYLGHQWQLHEIGWVDLPTNDPQDSTPVRALRIVLSCRKGGQTVIAQNSPRNPFHFINPPILLPDGVENLIEAAKIMLAATLDA